ncbi:hypothetical protein DPMN_112006 [Dreissena polymorpha]|uniref:Uncharacterized protein n=1 Tax=Dreissena polymorpha TaxID=45954 RepID=A0A9D4KEV4_DREPO|nr:hypothetical protein DPMN_112006 [Dreissena polymorpha]
MAVGDTIRTIDEADDSEGFSAADIYEAEKHLADLNSAEVDVIKSCHSFGVWDVDIDQWLKIDDELATTSTRSWLTRLEHVRRLRRTTTKRTKKKWNRYLRCRQSLQASSKVSNGWRPLHMENHPRHAISSTEC